MFMDLQKMKSLLEIDETGKIVNGEVSVMIDGKYEVDTLKHFLERIRPETID